MAIDRVKTKANAEKFLKANRLPEAIRELQKLADDNPRDIQVLNQIGQLHLRLGNRDMAVPSFLKVAELFSKQGFFTKAVASLKIVTREAPENLSAWEMLASLSEQQGFAREAWSAHEKVAELYGRSGNISGVIEVQKKLLDLEPDNLKIQVQLGDNLIKTGRREEGVKHYLKAGGKLIAQGHIKEAARMYERALQLDPTHFSALEAAVKTHLSHQQGEVALQLLDTLLERAPTAEGILLLKADVLNEERQFAAAEAACRSVMETNPSSSGAMFRLVRSLVMQQRIDDASGMVVEWLKQSGASKEKDAEALFEEILRFSSGHLGSLQGLVETARLSGQRENLTRALGALAEGAAAQGPLALARDALQELVQLEPNSLQLAEKLHAIEKRMGLSTQPFGQSPHAAPSTPPPVTLPTAPQVSPSQSEEPPIDLDVVVEETGEAEIDIDMDDLNLESVEHTSSLSSRATAGEDAAPQVSVESEESLAQEISRDREEMPTLARPALSSRDANDIRDQLTEAEVFLKYGLVEKAIGELQTILKKVPDHIHAHQKLIAIYRSQKKGDKLLRQLLKLATIFRDQGDQETSAHLVDEARSIDSNHKALAEWGRTAEPDSLTAMLQGAAAKAATVPPLPLQEPILDLEAMAAGQASPGGQASLDEEFSPHGDQPPRGVLGEFELEEEVLGPMSSQESRRELDSAESLEQELDRSLSAPPAEAPSEDAELAEQLEEAEFYLNQELFGEAQRALKALDARWPSDPHVKSFREKMARLVPPGEEESYASRARASFPEEPEAVPEIAVEDLLQVPPFPGHEPAALTVDEAVPVTEATVPVTPAQPEVEESLEPPAAGRGRTKMKVSVRDLLPEEEPSAQEPLAKENEYYDLASELGAALDGLQGPEESLFDEEGKSPEEMSFEEVFEEFKKGVEKKVGEEDYATHYNLGIAYKEMELLDEAVGEFQIAARSPQYFVECCSMLGICFRQKGLNELAEKWYRKGIAAPGFAEDVYVGLKYDLADCLADQGRPEEANALFKEVYAIQSNYRDVSTRIK